MIPALITKMIACSGILYCYYWLFLRNKKFHHYNRFYLLGVTVLSIIIPFIKIPVILEHDNATSQIVYKSIDILSVDLWENELVENLAITTTSTWPTLQNCLFVLYGAGVLFLMYALMRSLLYVYRLSNKYRYEYVHTLKLYNTTEPGTPFSFLRSIFWNSQLDLNSTEGKQIFRHELFHVKQKHSADILFLECIGVFLWINPFFHLVKKEMKAIHEFLADQHAITNNDRIGYAELLVLQSIHAKRSPMSNYFFQNHIKRRIAMITQFKNKNYSYWTRLMVLPLSVLLFCAVALYAQNPKQTKAITKTSTTGSFPEMSYQASETSLTVTDTIPGNKKMKASAMNENQMIEDKMTESQKLEMKKKAQYLAQRQRELEIAQQKQEKLQLQHQQQAELMQQKIQEIHEVTIEDQKKQRLQQQEQLEQAQQKMLEIQKATAQNQERIQLQHQEQLERTQQKMQELQKAAMQNLEKLQLQQQKLEIEQMEEAQREKLQEPGPKPQPKAEKPASQPNPKSQTKPKSPTNPKPPTNKKSPTNPKSPTSPKPGTL
jgi:beta-lactamase regulating signal transducer with metallopeptidase domain